jgi:hypothetical protein
MCLAALQLMCNFKLVTLLNIYRQVNGGFMLLMSKTQQAGLISAKFAAKKEIQGRKARWGQLALPEGTDGTALTALMALGLLAPQARKARKALQAFQTRQALKAPQALLGHKALHSLRL